MSRFTASGTGAALAAGTVASYAAGVLLGYPVLVMLAVGALAMFAMGGLALAVRPSVTLTRQVSPDRTTVGEPALGRLDVRNLSRWPAPAFTAIDQVGTAGVSLPVGVVSGRGRRSVYYPIQADQRGLLRLGPLTVERRDPLGLFVWKQRQAGDAVLWVHPRVHPMRPLPVGVVPDYEARTTENARLGTVTFSSLREYVPGDDPRQIHWRSTARTGLLIVREHVDTTEPTTTVVLDTRDDTLGEEKFEHAVEIAASVVRAVEDVGRPVSLHVLGQRREDTLAAGARGTLDRLTLAERTTGTDPLRLIETVDRVAGGGALVVVTGPVEAGVLGRLAEQRRRFTPVVIVSVVPPDHATGTRRRPGMVVLTVRSAADGAGAWHRMVNGDLG